MTKTAWHLCHSLIQYHKKYCSYHVTKTASYKNGISKLLLFDFSSSTNTLLTKPTPANQHKIEKLEFKNPVTMSLDHTTISRILFKELFSSAQLLACDLWVFFYKVSHYCQTTFLWVLLAAGCPFCLLYLMVLFYMYSVVLSNFTYLQFYQ